VTFPELKETLDLLAGQGLAELQPELGVAAWTVGRGGCYVTLTPEGRLAGEADLEAAERNRIGFR
jgi:hypothetical protein